MKVNSEIFRAYDIRGIAGKELTEEGIFYIGKAIGTLVLSEGRKSLLTARDGRISGPSLLRSFQEGYDEALLLDTENYISEGSGENLFAVKNGELFTPSLDASLDGITRKAIISLAEELGMKVNVKDLSESDITSSDELFFTGTAAEVVPITQVNNLKIGSGRRGKVTEVLQKNYFDQVRGKRSSFPEWHTLVD